MPTRYDNKLIITGSPKNIWLFARKNVESCQTDDVFLYRKGFCLSVLHPEPDCNPPVDYDAYCGWRYANWGCKWAQTQEYEIYDNRISIMLETANGAIFPWVAKVSEDFPDLLFNLKWQGGRDLGAFIVKNGLFQKRNLYYDNGRARSYLIVTGDAATLTAFDMQFQNRSDYAGCEGHPVQHYSFGNFIPTARGHSSIQGVSKKSEIKTLGRSGRKRDLYDDYVGARPDEPETEGLNY